MMTLEEAAVFVRRYKELMPDSEPSIGWCGEGWSVRCWHKDVDGRLFTACSVDAGTEESLAEAVCDHMEDLRERPASEVAASLSSPVIDCWAAINDLSVFKHRMGEVGLVEILRATQPPSSAKST